jgi:hypothetical protein
VFPEEEKKKTLKQKIRDWHRERGFWQSITPNGIYPKIYQNANPGWLNDMV